MENLFALLAATLALTGSPGPATLACAAAGAAYGRRALVYVLAVTCGTMTVMVLVASGLTGLITAIPGAVPVITLLAAAYIIYLAWRIAMAPPLGEIATQDTLPSPLGGYLMAIANPKAYGAMGALFSGFELVPGPAVWNSMAIFFVVAPFPIVVNTTWMMAGTGLARLMRDPKRSRALNVFFAVLLVASVIAVLML